MKQSTAKALIVRTAKAHGVKSVEDNLIAAAGQVRSEVIPLMRRGEGDMDTPASQVYNKAELYAVTKSIRALQNQAQNLPPAYVDRTYIIDRVTAMSGLIMKAIQRMGATSRREPDADSVAYRLKDIAYNCESVIKRLKQMRG